jgi:UDP-N-acetylmuramoylalanine--D-glutamate ligase
LVIDNGVSTTPDSTLAALAEISGPCTLLLGGKAKLGLPFDELASAVAQGMHRVVAFGAARESIAPAMERAGVEIRSAEDLERAVAAAFQLAAPGTTILFSPAAASFDAYANFEDRAAHFRALLPPAETPQPRQRERPDDP